MPITREEEVTVLYALHCCGGKASKSRAIEFVLTQQLLKPREGDEDIVSGGDTRIVNRLAWSRQNLKAKGHLAMPYHGTWQITESGRERLFRLARRLHEDASDEIPIFDNIIFARFTSDFLDKLRALGATLPKPAAPSA